jgi:hypothetical protein
VAGGHFPCPVIEIGRTDRKAVIGQDGRHTDGRLAP